MPLLPPQFGSLLFQGRGSVTEETETQGGGDKLEETSSGSAGCFMSEQVLPSFQTCDLHV